MNDQKVVSLEEQRLVDNINELGKEFGVVPTTDIPTIYEDFFVRVFLPLFAGDEQNTYNVNNAMWLNIARSPFAEVRVVNSARQELFLVPPLFDQSVIQPMTGAGEQRNLPTVTDMLARARMIGKQGANAMNRFLTEELDRRNFVISADGVKSITQRWIDIFKRYDRLPKDLELGATGATSSGFANSTDRDSQDFDPLPD